MILWVYLLNTFCRHKTLFGTAAVFIFTSLFVKMGAHVFGPGSKACELIKALLSCGDFLKHRIVQPTK